MAIKKYKIIAIVQINNEIRKGNLERFFSYLPKCVDDIVVYDDASTDGSWEYAQQFTRHVIRGTKNNFVNEWEIKQQLVAKALGLNPDFILHIDADEVLSDNDGSKLQELARQVTERNLDGALLYEHNLWRSHSWRRMDSDFGDVWFLRFWRVRDTLTYSNRHGGLHQSPAPDQILKYERQDVVTFLHFGFASEKDIVTKYISYANRGQRGEDLARFISEEKYLRLESVDKELYPEGLWKYDNEPKPLSLTEWYKIIDKYRDEIEKPNISIVCLVYQSTAWLQFVYNQILKYTDLSDKEFFFVANDATPEVKAFLHDNYIPHYIFDNTEDQRKEWYINNVYRAWNYGAKKAKGDFILFVNSDMAFSPNWVENMMSSYNGKNCVTARLVERNTIPKDDCIIQKNFGDHLTEYREEDFVSFAKENTVPETRTGGAYMPLLIRKNDFEKVGGYPEGNALDEGQNTNIHNPIIAKQGDLLVSGDIILMSKLKEQNVIHETTLNSMIYHFQEGEMRDVATKYNADKDVEVVIVNNSLTGIANEKVFWNFLLEKLPRSVGVDMSTVGASQKNFTEKAASYIKENHPNARFVIQNATFIDCIRPDLHTISLLQDDLRRMNKLSLQQEDTLAKTHTHVANSRYTAASYPDYAFNIIPLGLDDELFSPGDKAGMRIKYNLPKDKPIGIFVGNMSSVKGWDVVEPIIREHKDIHWILVSKNTEAYDAPNTTCFSKISQSTLAELHQASDFFILGSPTETQCLAALEAGLCDIPIIMPLTGIFTDWTEEERSACGIFGNDLKSAVDMVLNKKFSPREMIKSKNLTVDTMIDRWWHLIAQKKLRTRTNTLAPIPHYSWKYKIRRKFKVIFSKQFLIILAKQHLSPKNFEKLLKLYRIIKKLKI